MSMGAMSDSFASSIAFSAVPPTPIPSMPGGHHPAPIVGTVFNTQSTSESDGFSITNLDLFSEPPPVAAIFPSTVLPMTSSKCTTAGVLSFVLRRAPSGSATIEGVGESAGRLFRLEFQNENLVLLEDGQPIATVPDIITLLDSHTGQAVVTEGVRFGQRVTIVAFDAPQQWTTEAGLAVVGPRAFGYDIDFEPVATVGVGR